MKDFWTSCGYKLLRRNADGRLLVTDDYLRAYFMRPELAPVPESCDAERALHDALMADPRRAVSEEEIGAIGDEDARENYRVMLRFREQLTGATTLEAFYFDLFRRDIAVPPDFVHQTAQVILRGILDANRNALEARAAEIFFRKQRVSMQDGAIMLADDTTVEMHALQAPSGSLTQLIREAKVQRVVDLDVLDEKNGEEYWRRDEGFDTVLSLNFGRPGALALCRVIERWVAHFHGVSVAVKPVREIPDEEWKWHVGLDAEATGLMNDIYNGGTVDQERMKRIIGLFRMEFKDAGVLRREMEGAPVFLGLAAAADGSLRMKPQNLLVNLPLALPA
jgi:uncharacterized protein DUF6352